jgi:hypothetical protein
MLSAKTFRPMQKSIDMIFYVIEVICGVSKWTVHRSFVDFSVLHNILRQTYPSLEFPSLPPRKDEKNKNYVQMRRKLQFFLSELIDFTFIQNLSKVGVVLYVVVCDIIVLHIYV